MHDAATVSIDEHITCSPTNSASLNLQDHISAGKTCHFKLPCEENTTPALRVRASNSYVHVASLEPKGGGTAFAQPGHLCQVQAGPMRCRVKLWLVLWAGSHEERVDPRCKATTLAWPRAPPSWQRTFPDATSRICCILSQIPEHPEASLG